MRRALIGLATALTVLTPIAAPSLRAQQLPVLDLRPGDTIRVWAAEPRLRGSVAALLNVNRDTLTIAVVPSPTNVAAYRGPVAVAALGSIEVQRRRRSLIGTVGGVIGGSIVGLLVGGIAGTLLECQGSCDVEWEGVGGFLIGGGLGIVAGGVTGGILGGRRGPRWEPISLKR